MKYLVGGLLLLVSLLVSSSFGFIGLALLLAEGLPLLSEKLADLTWKGQNGTCLVVLGSLPNLMPGLSSRTLSRWSLAKNMYAESPRLGALGSDRISICNAEARERHTLLLLASVPGFALGAGRLLLRHDVGYSGKSATNVKYVSGGPASLTVPKVRARCLAGRTRIKMRNALMNAFKNARQQVVERKSVRRLDMCRYVV